MSKSPVFHEHIIDESVASALREHVEDRSQLLKRLTGVFVDDPRIRAAWFWGSFGRGDADDLSDLDLWLAVPDEFVPEMASRLIDALGTAGEVISAGESPRNAPAGGGYIGALLEGRHGMLHVDLYWQSLSTIDGVPDIAALLPGASTGLLPIFNRLDEWMPPLTLAPPPSRVETDSVADEILRRIGFIFLMLSIAAKYLARDPASDMSLMLYPKPAFEEAIGMLDAAEVVGEVDWSVPPEPVEKVARLRYLIDKADLVGRCAIAKNVLISPRYGVCLGEYMNLVESIVRSCGLRHMPSSDAA